MSTTNPTTPAEIDATFTTAHSNLCLILSQLNTTLPIVRSVCTTNGDAARKTDMAKRLNSVIEDIQSEARRTLLALNSQAEPRTSLDITG